MEQERHVGSGPVALFYDDWHAVLAALEGDASQQDNAFDALYRWAPGVWLEAHDEAVASESRAASTRTSAAPTQ